LSIDTCYDSASSSRPLRQSLPRVYLPNLLEISYRGDGSSVESKPFTTISTWTMSSLRSLHFSETPLMATSLLYDLFKLLPTHGSQLQHLTFTSTHLREDDISKILTVCTDLRSLEIDSPISLFALSASHAGLEKIRISPWLVLDLMSDRRMDVVVDALKSLKLKAKTSFPRLIEVDIILDISSGVIYPPAKASFRTAEASIIFRDGTKIYNLFDGRTDLVGAYCVQVIDRTELSSLDIYFLRSAFVMVEEAKYDTDCLYGSCCTILR
jgi:hypothetical protein